MASRVLPSRTRPKVGPSQDRTEPMMKMAMDDRTICLALKRRVRKAVRGTMTPMTSWKMEVIHWPVVTLMPNSLTMVGKAAESWSWVKLPRKVMKVRVAREMKAGLVSLPLV